MAYRVFIDGQQGTTGLKIYERFAERGDIELLQIDSAKRKDSSARKELFAACDVAFLCLPDEAAIEAVALAQGMDCVLIDASTAHRTHPDWAYGFAELSAQHRQRLQNGRRIAVPGCFPTGFTAAVYPLVAKQIAANDFPFVCHAVTGYSGGGKKMIAQYEDTERNASFGSPRAYALGQHHKHQKEMRGVCGLAYTPIFNPIVADFYSGMVVSLPLYPRLLKKRMDARALWEFYSDYYKDEPFIRVMPFGGEGILADGFLPANAQSGANGLELFVFGDDERVLVCARFDNLGKGSSGAAVQCMNIALGLEQVTGLTPLFL